MKRNYFVYFELYGKKLKIKVMADSEENAKGQIKKDLIFHKVEKIKDDVFNECSDMLDGFMDALKKNGIR